MRHVSTETMPDGRVLFFQKCEACQIVVDPNEAGCWGIASGAMQDIARKRVAALFVRR